MFIKNRIKFHKTGSQKSFIEEAKEKLNLTWIDFAKKLKINQRTLNEWTKERFNMSESAMLLIIKLTKLPLPQNYSIIKWNEHLNKISISGGRARYAKYGKVSITEERRKEKWRQWWESKGQYKKPASGFKVLTKIKTPLHSKLLAEFVGIMLGDGGVNKYQTSVTLSGKEQSYIQYVSKMVKKLFGVNPKVYILKDAKAVKVVVNRKQLVAFCQDIGLVQGNKVRQQASVPDWVKENKEFTKECLRGLIDTDGCFYNNSYKVRGKNYAYQKIAFTNSSLPLILFVYEALNKLGIRSSIQRGRKEVRIAGGEDVSRYVKEVGTHNSKHLEKIK